MGAPSIRCAVVTRPARHNKTLPRQSVPRQGKFNPTPRAEASESSNWDDTEPPNQLPDMFQGKRQQQQAGREGYLPLTRSITPPGTSRREAQNPPPLGRRASPDVIQRKHPGRTNTPYINQTVPGRNRERFVPLPDDGDAPAAPVSVATIPEDLPDAAGVRGRITIYCTAEAYDRKKLETSLRARQSRWLLQSYPDVLYGQYWAPGLDEPKGDVFYFDYGVVAFWGLTAKEEQDVLDHVVAPVELQPLRATEVEMDEFEFVYSMTERPNIQNDLITINYKLLKEHMTKLSICFALSQSTKLLVYEERVLSIVQSTRSLPLTLAQSGKVHMSRKQIAQLMGRVFIQKSAVNLLSSVLDTPEFFWSSADSFQNIYKKACEYLEYDTRVEVLNNRFQVLQEMLDMLRDHQNAHHAGRLEWIVIWLIVIEVFVGLLEVAGLFGLIGNH